MQRRNRVVLMLSGGVMLSGVLSGTVSLGWDAFRAMRLRASAAQSLSHPDLAPAFGSPVAGTHAPPPSLGPRPSALTPEVPPDAQAPRYTVLALDALTQGHRFHPIALNHRGDVLGGLASHDPSDRIAQTRLDAALYRNGKIVRVQPLPGYQYSWPMALNNRGQVVCVAYNPGYPRNRPVTTRGGAGVVQHASFAAPVPVSRVSMEPETVQAGGELPERRVAPQQEPLRSPETSQTPQYRILLWDNGRARDLHIAEQLAKRGVGSNVADMMHSARIGINDQAQITLHLDSLYWWSRGHLHLAGGRIPASATLLPLNNKNVLVRPSVRAVAGTYDRMMSSSLEWYDVARQQEVPLIAGEVWDMNDSCEVLSSNFFAGEQPVRQYQIVNRQGERRTVATVPYFGKSFLNDKGQVVGLSARSAPGNATARRLAPGAPQKGPFWCGANRLYDLNDLIPKNSGWTIMQVRDFNNQGEILVWAHDAAGRVQALLLRPAKSASKKQGRQTLRA